MFVTRTVIILCFSSLTAAHVCAKTLQITDQNGQPLPGAVVEIEHDIAMAADTTIAVMDQVGKRFSPRLLTINKGQAVRFPNSDDIRHHVYSFSKTKPFELKLYAGTPKAPINFEQSGIVVLGCNIHDSMVGYIYVADSQSVYVSNALGNIELPDFTQRYTVWHERQARDISERIEFNWPIRQRHQKIIITTSVPLPRNTFGEVFKEHHGH